MGNRATPGTHACVSIPEQLGEMVKERTDADDDDCHRA